MPTHILMFEHMHTHTHTHTLMHAHTCAYTHTHAEIQYWRNRLVGVAAAFRGRVTVVISDEEEYRREVEVLGMAEWGEDVAVGLWASDRARYTFTGEVGEDELTDFLEVRMYLIPDLCLIRSSLHWLP